MLSTGLSSEAQEELSVGLDAPAGRIDVIPSAVTGKPLRYATPAKLSELLQRCLVYPAPEQLNACDPVLVPWLFPVGAYRASKGVIDSEQARRLGEIAHRHVNHLSYESVLQLGQDIHPATKSLREEIVFSGAGSASHANHVYTPHELLPALIEDLIMVLNRPPTNIDAGVFAAIVGFYCSCIHPFKDGNGRWTRVLAMQAAVSAGSPKDGVLVCAFLAMFYAELAGDIWPACFSNGMRRYLSAVTRFRDVLHRKVDESAQKPAVGDLLETLKASARSAREYERLVIQVFSRNALDPQEIKKFYGLSTRRMEGLSARIQAIGDLYQMPDISHEPVLIPALWNMISEAKLSTLENWK